MTGLAKARLFNHLGDMVKIDKLPPESAETTATDKAPRPAVAEKLPREIGGQKGPEPTRYGDWEKNGRCTDF